MRKKLYLILTLTALTLVLTSCKLQEGGDNPGEGNNGPKEPTTVLPEPLKPEEVSQKIKVHLFWRNGCPYCENAKVFFNGIKGDYSDCFEFVTHDTDVEKESELFFAVSEKLKISKDDLGKVPLIVIGNEHEVGYAERMNVDLIETIKSQCSVDKQEDLVAKISNELKKAEKKN